MAPIVLEAEDLLQKEGSSPSEITDGKGEKDSQEDLPKKENIKRGEGEPGHKESKEEFSSVPETQDPKA